MNSITFLLMILSLAAEKITTASAGGCTEKVTCNSGCESRIDDKGCYTCYCPTEPNPCKGFRCLPNEVCEVSTINKKPSCVAKCEILSNCARICPYGFMQDSNGCDICRCNDPCADLNCNNATHRCEVKKMICDSAKCPFRAVCEKKCNEPCNLTCLYYETDARGCRKCKCKDLCKNSDCDDGLVCKPCAEAPCDTLYECVPECKKTNCSAPCKYGNRVDDYGCPLCDCVDPCKANSCTSRQYCLPQQVKCNNPNCKFIARCFEKTSSCECSGDPHCTTFDGAGTWDYQGTCKFVLAKSVSNSGLQNFVVYLKNINLYGQQAVSFVDWIEIFIYGRIVRLERESLSPHAPIILKVDDAVVNIPFASGYASDDGNAGNGKGNGNGNGDGGFNVTYFGSDARLITDFGLTIEYGLSRSVSLTLPPTYMNKTEGFCGNFDGNMRNDYVTKGGVGVEDIGRDTGRKIGDSWIALDKGQTMTQCRAPDVITDTCAEESAKCKLITLHDGPFSQCLNNIDYSGAIAYQGDCQFDFQAFGCDERKICSVLEHFATLCSQLGYPAAWRSKALCPCQCQDPNAECRKEESSACQPTCTNPDGANSCTYGTVKDTCVCKRGFVLFNSTCIPQEQCGCVNQMGQAVRLGETWLENGCSSMRVCIEGGAIDDQPHSCLDSETCVKEVCVPSPKTTTITTTIGTTATRKPSIITDECNVKSADRVDCGVPYPTERTCKVRNCCFDASAKEAIKCYKTKTPETVRCSVAPGDRIDCGLQYFNEKICSQYNCCFVPSNSNKGVSSQCYKPNAPEDIAKCEPLKNCYSCKSGYRKDPKTNCDICACSDPCEKNNCTALQECVSSGDKTTFSCVNKCCPLVPIPRSCYVPSMKNLCQVCRKTCAEVSCGANRICCDDYYGCKTCEVPTRCLIG